MGTRKDVLYNGQIPGNTASDGTAATAGNTGASQTPTVTSGGSIIFRTAAKHPGSPLGLRFTASTGGAVSVRQTTDAASLTMARTLAFTTPSAVPATAGQSYTIATMRSTTQGVFLRLNWNNTSGAGHLTITKVTGTTHDLGAFSPGTKLALLLWVTVGTGSPSTNGVLHAALVAEGSTTHLVDVDVTNVDLGNGNTVIEFDLGWSAGVAAGDAGIYFDGGPDSVQSGLTSYLAPLTDSSAPVATGGAASLDSAGSWTASPSGTLVGVVSDNDDTTMALSSASPSSEDKVRFANVRITPKVQLQINMNLQASGGTAGTWYVRLYDGATLKKTWSDLVANGIPTTLVLDATTSATLTKDPTDGSWSALHVEFGYGP